MKGADVLRIINRLELKYPVQKWEIKNVKIWPLIRTSIYWSLIDQIKTDIKPDGYEYPATKNTLQVYLIKIKLLLKGLRQSILLIAKSNKKTDYLFTSYRFNRHQQKGEWVDKLCDPIIDVLEKNEKKSIVIELPGTVEDRTPKYKKNRVVDFTYISYFIAQLSKVTSLFNFKVKLDKYEDFLSELPETAKANNLKNKLSAIHLQVGILLLYSFLFKLLIKKNKIKCVFSTDYGLIESFALNLAAYHEKIPSVDLQHGIHGHDYGKWENIPISGFELLPKLFACWDDHFTENLNSQLTGNAFHKAFTLGIPWIFVDKYSSIDQQKIQETPKREKKNILYTAQPIIEIFPEKLLKTIAKTQSIYNWMIRLHPMQVNKAFIDEIKKLLSKEGIRDIQDISFTSSAPLINVLGSCDLHITQWSAAVIEAKALSIPSICISTLAHEYFEYLAPTGLVYILDHEDDIDSKIAEIFSVNKIKESPKNIFESGVQYLINL